MLTAKHTADMGFRESRLGTPMLRCAVNYVAGKPRNTKVLVTEDVYPYVACEFGVRPTAVEKNIRDALRQAGVEMNSKSLILLLADRVRNGEFTA